MLKNNDRQERAPGPADTTPALAALDAAVPEGFAGCNLPGSETVIGLSALARSAPHGLVLFVYPKDATSGCTQEADEFQACLSAFAEAGVALAGVSKDTAASHRRFATARGYAYPLLADPTRRLLGRLGCVYAGSMYGKTVQKTERATFYFGPDGRCRAAWRQVAVPGHAEAVLAAVRAQTAADPALS